MSSTLKVFVDRVEARMQRRRDKERKAFVRHWHLICSDPHNKKWNLARSLRRPAHTPKNPPDIYTTCDAWRTQSRSRAAGQPDSCEAPLRPMAKISPLP